ncbi:uncharacterized serine-rich protein C215.13-like [Rhagoletis pomonella]|uniref:uncharacterized serine-rich protein C215.13-like n=1 Tax=Rhagoletis pomonella TaxID=28610 RepID=UPI001783200F|nr:uncharacterized serine-rich protein C215.13-like [Rhagoletis pomonella]
MSDRHRRYYGGGFYSGAGTSTGRYQKSSTTAASALDRLRSNLSPVSAYYKPLMRSFGKRADDDRKDNDKDKTPTASGSGKQTAISRFENKYSDILDRHRHHDDDRDKTLEPDENRNPLAKSATSHQLLGVGRPKLSSSSFNAADRKERTPYRLARNKTNRYLGDSNDSGYLTSTNGSRADHALLDDNYPLDYSASRYRRHHDVPRHHLENYEALQAGGAMGYAPGTSRYGRGPDYAAGYNARSYRSRDVHDDYDTASGSSRRARGYGRNKTSENLLSSAIDTTPSAHSSNRPDHDDYGVPNSRNRFANRRRENYTQRAPPPREELTDEDREILNDERSSADNAAILLLLKEDNQFLEARKFEERMRRRKELKERALRYAQEDAAAAAAEQIKAKKKQEKEKEKDAADDADAASPKTSGASDANCNNVESNAKAVEATQKATSKPKKVASPISDSDSSEESSSEESDSSSQEAKSTNPTPSSSTTTTTTTTTTTPATKDTQDDTKTTTSTNLSTIKPTTTTTSKSTLSAASTAYGSSANYSATATASLHADRNNNDLSKYRPTAGPIFKSNGLMHSSSSGALAFGGISERLAAGRTQRYQPAATSRTAALLAELDSVGSPADGGIGSSSSSSSSNSRYQQHKNLLLSDSYKSSYLFDPYYSYGSGSGSSAASSRRAGAAAAFSSSSASAYQRQQMHAYQQQQQQHQQYQQHMLSKSATSAALFQRSRIPKTLSAFVS